MRKNRRTRSRAARLVVNAASALAEAPHLVTNRFQSLRTNVTVAKTWHEELDGKRYLVVPMVMITEGVHNGSAGPLKYDREDVEKTPESWDMKPVVVFHPQRNGQGISACKPEVVESQGIGLIMRSKTDRIKFNGKELCRLRAQAWIDEAKAEKVSPAVLNAVRGGQMLEVSTGLFTDNEEKSGVWRGEAFSAVARNYRPDHLAILPGLEGSCSTKDGAGLLRNQDGELHEGDEVVENAWTDAQRDAANKVRAQHQRGVNKKMGGKGFETDEPEDDTHHLSFQGEDQENGQIEAPGEELDEKLHGALLRQGFKKQGGVYEHPKGTRAHIVHESEATHVRFTSKGAPTTNAWTDAARKAAEEARKGHANAGHFLGGKVFHGENELGEKDPYSRHETGLMPGKPGDSGESMGKIQSHLEKRGFKKEMPPSSHNGTFRHPDGTKATVYPGNTKRTGGALQIDYDNEKEQPTSNHLRQKNDEDADDEDADDSGYSFEEVRKAIYDRLDKKYGKGSSTYLEAVYPTFFVFSTLGDGASKFYFQKYHCEPDGAAQLDDLPREVTKSIQYRDTEGKVVGNAVLYEGDDGAEVDGSGRATEDHEVVSLNAWSDAARQAAREAKHQKMSQAAEGLGGKAHKSGEHAGYVSASFPGDPRSDKKGTAGSIFFATKQPTGNAVGLQRVAGHGGVALVGVPDPKHVEPEVDGDYPEDEAQNVAFERMARKILDRGPSEKGTWTKGPAVPTTTEQPTGPEGSLKGNGPVTKNEGGREFPAQCYAYAPDRSDPATWNLRLYARPGDAVPDADLAVEAAEALSSSGLHGRRAEIPSAAVASVRARVLNALEDAEKWIAGAIKKPGALRKSLHAKEGEPIPAGELEEAAKSKNAKTAARARLALTLKKLRTNAWSDAARKAAEEAKKSHASALYTKYGAEKSSQPGADQAHPHRLDIKARPEHVESHLNSMGFSAKAAGPAGVLHHESGVTARVSKSPSAPGAKLFGTPGPRTRVEFKGGEKKPTKNQRGSSGDSQDPTTENTEDQVDKLILINALISKGGFSEEDRASLELMSAGTLQRLVGNDELELDEDEEVDGSDGNATGVQKGGKKPKATKTDPEKVAATGKGTTNLKEYVEAAPPEIRQILNSAVTGLAAEKTALVKAITGNAACGFTVEELGSWDVEQLRKLAKVAAPATAPRPVASFLGNGLDAFVQSPTANQGPVEEPLACPSLPFGAQKVAAGK